MAPVLAICLGACAGALLRWRLGLWLSTPTSLLPWGTLAANWIGAYAIGQGSIPSARLREYLRSLQEKFPNYEQLLVMDSQGRIIASGSAQASSVQLPSDWQKTMRQDNQLVGDSRWDERAGKGRLLVAVPITRADGQLIGAFAAEIGLAPIQKVLQEFAIHGPMLSLASESGKLVATSNEMTAEQFTATISGETLRHLSEREHAAALLPDRHDHLVDIQAMHGIDEGLGTVHHLARRDHRLGHLVERPEPDQPQARRMRGGE